MLKRFKDILTLILHLSSVLVQCFTYLAQAVTSQAENRKPLKRTYIMIMPEYLFEIDGFRRNRVNVIKENYSITDKLGFGISACDVTGSFPSPLTR